MLYATRHIGFVTRSIPWIAAVSAKKFLFNSFSSILKAAALAPIPRHLAERTAKK